MRNMDRKRKALCGALGVYVGCLIGAFIVPHNWILGTIWVLDIVAILVLAAFCTFLEKPPEDRLPYWSVPLIYGAVPISHDYMIALRRLQPAEGGGYVATIPQLGTGTFNGVGEAPEEALRRLNEIYNYLRPELEAEGVPFAPPVDDHGKLIELEGV